MKTDAIRRLIKACEILENTISGVLCDEGIEDKAAIDEAKAELSALETALAWHGPDGLLAEIAEKDKVWPFATALMDVLDCPRDTMREWYLVAGARATSTQLAAALCKATEEADGTT